MVSGGTGQGPRHGHVLLPFRIDPKPVEMADVGLAFDDRDRADDPPVGFGDEEPLTLEPRALRMRWIARDW